MNGTLHLPDPANEPIKSYAPGTPERKAIKAELQNQLNNPIEIPIIIDGKEIKSGNLVEIRCPHDRSQLLGTYHQADSSHAALAIETCDKARHDWSRMPWEHRAAIMLKAADLLAGPHRDAANASTMLGQSKTVFQAEIDAACELIDFWRFNAHYMTKLYDLQPGSAPTLMNYVEYRPLEGFIFAVTPFNFSSIAGNLPTAPALMGNTAFWKPASSAVHSAYYLMKVLEEAGMPPGVINMVPGAGSKIGPVVLKHPNLGGVHFTGSTAVFGNIWNTIGSDILSYKSYPRIVGETGGKDFIFAHSSADVAALTTAIIRGSFEYQGQKCSAASRAYVPSNLWPELKDRLIADAANIKMGDICDFSNFMGAVIDASAFRDITGYIEHIKNDPTCEIITGGGYSNGEDNYFIEPTIAVTTDPHAKTMEEEIFGPVMTIYVYPEDKYEENLHVCDQTSIYALTGAIFSQDRAEMIMAMDILRHAAGNFYINDKPTGAVVGQQPFGGSRASGTNDKAGSMANLERWVTPRTVKENFVPPTDFSYPHMDAE